MRLPRDIDGITRTSGAIGARALRRGAGDRAGGITSDPHLGRHIDAAFVLDARDWLDGCDRRDQRAWL